MDKIRIYIALLFCQAISFILPVQAQDNTGNNSNRYNTLYSYDGMGNITSLSRNGLLDDGSYDYYPYGGLMANSTNHNQQRYKYNGKELDRMHGLDWYDYGARWMDAAIGRWHVMDPLCEKYYDHSTYVYAGNNPINLIDPDGRIEYPLSGYFAINKRDLGGKSAPPNAIVRTSTFNEKRNIGTSPHIGIDYRAAINTPVYSLGPGTVVGCGTFKNGIKYISIKMDKNGDTVRFLHLNSISSDIKVGTKVEEGQEIGLSGNSGTYRGKNGEQQSYQPHLHVDATDKNGNKVSPEQTQYGEYTNQDFFGNDKQQENSLYDIIYGPFELQEVIIVRSDNISQ